ncbi:MAG TPA: CoA pyrophosphatase [Flavobacterium sp.]
MDFKTFLQIVPNIAKVALPGDTAHIKMAPPERRELMKKLDSSINPRKAAVLMLVYPQDEIACLSLIRRNSYKGVHSSQIAFPGGKSEEYDASPLYTALRETEEEIGVPREQVNLIAPFSEVYIPPSNFLVSPFLGYAVETPVFIPDSREVVEVLHYPLADLLDNNKVILSRMATSYSESIEVPVFKFQNETIWGATAMMLSELKEVLKIALK